MEIPGWAYIAVGAIVGGSSAYIFFFVPKNGSPNTAMAVFACIGAVFVLIGLFKMMFQKIDKKPVTKKQVEQVAVQLGPQKVNRIEEQIKAQYAQQYNMQQNPAMQNPMQQNPMQPAQNQMNNVQQTSVYPHQTHQHHAHPQHIQHQNHQTQSTAQHNQHHQAHIYCPNCGNPSSPTANFCSMCGTRLR